MSDRVDIRRPRSTRRRGQRPFLGFASKILDICELPHIGAGKKYANPYQQAQCDAEGVPMLAWIIGIVVAIGLIWSVAAMSNLVPVVADLDSAAISRPAG